jgi:cell division protein ZapA (FtsZ GTPase activity inhibitor)
MAQVTVNLKIHNRSYKIKVDESEESFIRETAEDINKQIATFQKKYKGRDLQDYFALTMIARMTAVKEVASVDEDELLDAIDKIDKLLS